MREKERKRERDVDTENEPASEHKHTQIIKYTIYSNCYTNHIPIEFIVESPYSNYHTAYKLFLGVVVVVVIVAAVQFSRFYAYKQTHTQSDRCMRSTCVVHGERECVFAVVVGNKCSQ